MEFFDIFLFSAAFFCLLFYFQKFLAKKLFIFENKELFVADNKVEKSLALLFKNPPAEVYVFFGSQTGTAQNLAQRFSDELFDRFNITVHVFDLSDFNCESFLVNIFPLSVFLLATYGEGEPTDSSSDFYDFITSEKNDIKISYTGFGLGNRTYEKYNTVMKNVDKKLLEMGSNQICDVGYGDDNVDLEGDFLEWKEKTFGELCKLLNIKYSNNNLLEHTPIYHLKQYNIHDIPSDTIFNGELSDSNTRWFIKDGLLTELYFI